MFRMHSSHSEWAATSLELCLVLAILLSLGGAVPRARGDGGDFQVYMPIIMKPGMLDPSFGLDGWVLTNFDGIYEGAEDMELQPDGKIVAVGDVSTVSPNYDFAVARYNQDGSLDPGFDGDGMRVTDFGASDDHAHAVALQVDGKIVVAGDNIYDFALVRYNSNGSLDNTFDGDGKLLVDISGTVNMATAVAIQTDGKILVAGYALSADYSFDIAVARINPNGSLDASFSGDGKVVTDVTGGDDHAYAIALQSDGKIVVAGYGQAPGTRTDFILARYHPDGTLDTSFSGDGKLVTDFADSYDCANALALQPDGKIIVVGSTGMEDTSDFALARYNPDGSLDISFSGDGKLGTDFVGSLDYGNNVVIQPDGKIFVVGHSDDTTSDLALARYHPNGSLDASFDVDGKLITDFAGGNEYGNAIALQLDGKIVVAGSYNLEGESYFLVVRYKE